MTTLEIIKILVISTCHISKQDSGVLTQQSNPLLADSFYYGWYVFIPDEGEDEEHLKLVPSLRPVFELARKNDCKYIRLDQDGDEVEELPRYDW